MKKHLFPLIIILLCLNYSFSQTTYYVDIAASPNGNGLTWPNAFNDLHEALDSAQMEGDEIWVATGIYYPGNNPSSSTFSINQNIKLYGGFEGTEGSIDERIPGNETILSGDLEENDSMGIFSDNAMTIVYVNNNISNSALIDGFTISGGYADGTANNHEKNGGGIFSYGTPLIRNCIFEQNFASNEGGGFFQANNGSEITKVENCRFEQNNARSGGGLNFANANGIVENCVFKENTVVEWSGGLGGAVGSVNNTSLEVINCDFESNVAGKGGGGLYYSLWGNNSNSSLLVRNCEFTKNDSKSTVGNNDHGNGGGLHIYASSSCQTPNLIIKDCSFTENICDRFGASVWAALEGDNVNFELRRSDFKFNKAPNADGATMIAARLGGTGNALVDSCFFEGNEALCSGGLEFASSEIGTETVNFTLTNSVFKKNKTTEGGALGLYCDWNAPTNIVIENCVLDSNEVDKTGSAIQFWPDGNQLNVTIKKTTITNNVSLLGGAIDSHLYDTLITDYAGSTNIHFENCLIANNSSSSATINSSTTYNMSFLNCTIAHNQSNGIELSDTSGLTLQNTILYNPGFTEYQANSNEVRFNSLGGNLFGDNSIENDTICDLVEADPLFVSTNNFHLKANSPAIDFGVDWDSLPEYDLDGNARVFNCVDKGAFESDYSVKDDCSSCTVGNKEIYTNEFLTIAPNPVLDYLNVKLPEHIMKQVTISLIDIQGKLVSQQNITGSQTIEVSKLPKGMYLLKVLDDKMIYTGRFIKL